ncbi:hypothetical protein [Moraxella atlantae]|uniref:Uncharacterized protein n=1 Tax=Faucicola atlantae TaxID=34059 RepID=A0A378Q2U2_9GAMM|nr:hypothetical protein [Moraxella atlantae]OPH35181.1 hypothetical protein B5J92_05890 [Moraxella atlantae]STY95079.1 Uncharacterised protein [Moraxella atlantae]
MTAFALSTFNRRARAWLTRRPKPTTAPTTTAPRVPKDILARLTAPTAPLTPPTKTRQATFWRVINTLAQDVGLAFLSDRPSQLNPNSPTLYLTHERVTGLLEDLILPLADITTAEFDALMIAFGGTRVAIESEWSIDIDGNGEPRPAYRIAARALINLNQPTIQAELKQIQSQSTGAAA